MSYLEQLIRIRDRYAQMLEARQGLPGLSWPESEEFLRTAIRELNEMIAAGDPAAPVEQESEFISQAYT